MTDNQKIEDPILETEAEQPAVVAEPTVVINPKPRLTRKPRKKPTLASTEPVEKPNTILATETSSIPEGIVVPHLGVLAILVIAGFLAINHWSKTVEAPQTAMIYSAPQITQTWCDNLLKPDSFNDSGIEIYARSAEFTDKEEVGNCHIQLNATTNTGALIIKADIQQCLTTEPCVTAYQNYIETIKGQSQDTVLSRFNFSDNWYTLITNSDTSRTIIAAGQPDQYQTYMFSINGVASAEALAQNASMVSKILQNR